jgi:hypothetical protein
MGWDNSRGHEVFVQESKKESLKWVQPWRADSRASWKSIWSVLELKTEDSGCQA